MGCDLCEVIGFTALVWATFNIFIPLAQYLYKLLVLSPVKPETLGEWAVVTGSTDGIGKAYACALAKRGMNIVLVSRSPYKLQNVAAEIEEKYKVKTKIVDIDFTTDPAEYKKRLETDLKGIEVREIFLYHKDIKWHFLFSGRRPG